jgi:hypothetical protein
MVPCEWIGDMYIRMKGNLGMYCLPAASKFMVLHYSRSIEFPAEIQQSYRWGTWPLMFNGGVWERPIGTWRRDMKDFGSIYIIDEAYTMDEAMTKIHQKVKITSWPNNIHLTYWPNKVFRAPYIASLKRIITRHLVMMTAVLPKNM